jgi:branched-chain amino acid transport system permease protein
MKKRGKLIILAVAIIVLLFLPFWITNTYYLNMLIMTLVYVTMSTSWNFIGGYCGQLSLGHVAFYGIGAYTCTLLYNNLGVSPWLGMLLGGIFAAVIGCLISLPCFKLKGPFFTLATLALAEVVRLISIYWTDLTNGSKGLYIQLDYSFANMCFETRPPYYFIILGITAAVLLVTRYVHHSKFGLYLTAVRENEDAARALGINVLKQKIMAMGLSGFFIGIAGAFTAQYLGFIDPVGSFANSISNNIMLMSIVGGNATILGPTIGAGILYPLNEVLRGWLGSQAVGLNIVVYGILLIFVVAVVPQGIGKRLAQLIVYAKTRIRPGEKEDAKNQQDKTIA